MLYVVTVKCFLYFTHGTKDGPETVLFCKNLFTFSWPNRFGSALTISNTLFDQDFIDTFTYIY